MSPDALSQEEIDALLEGGKQQAPAVALDLLAPYWKMVAECMREAVSSLVGAETTVEYSTAATLDRAAVAAAMPRALQLKTAYSGSLEGATVFLLGEEDALALARAAAGGEGPFSDGEQQALQQAWSACLDAVSRELSAHLSAGPEVEEVQSGMVEAGDPEQVSWPEGEGAVQVTYHVSAPPHLEAADIFQLLSPTLFQSLAEAFSPSEPPAVGQEQVGISVPSAAERESMPQPVVFEALAPQKAESEEVRNLDLILDIGLMVKVELGRAVMKVKDILDLGPGSVIELNKLAGEPVDMLVNDKLFARGEVVVIDENFGVRITDILTVAQRLENLR